MGWKFHLTTPLIYSLVISSSRQYVKALVFKHGLKTTDKLEDFIYHEILGIPMRDPHSVVANVLD